MEFRTSIVLAMREPHMSRLLNGEKTAEVRRTSPTVVVYRLYLYRRGHIHGYVDVAGYAAAKWHPSDSGIANAVRKYHAAAMLDPEDMRRYLKGAASPCIYLVKNPVRLQKPLPVGIRPQSWQYATEEIQAWVEKQRICEQQ